MKNIADISAAYRLDESEFGKLRERDAEHKAAEERYGRSYQALPKEQDADILFVHAEDVIESELFLPASDKKRICIEKKDAGEYGDDPAAEHEHDADRTLAECALERLAVAQENNDIIHHYHAYLRQDIRQIEALVLSYPIKREARIEKLFHLRSPPVASRVRVSDIF